MSPLDSPALRAKQAGKRGGGQSATQAETRDGMRADLQLIAEMIEPGSRVLDVGCGDGQLLHHLVADKQVTGRGLELSQDGVNAMVSNGLSVVQGDADTDLVDFPDRAFDYVVLSQTLQATRDPRFVLEQLVRIGRHAIVSFPNFGYWRIRLRLLFGGRMPVTESLPDRWFETQNIHLCTLLDFLELCRACDIVVEKGLTLDKRGQAQSITGRPRANLFATDGLFLLRQG
ncbi:methionine biosynthesis protein MetW [Algihabitans sp.]|uniref:methionine biosynthesis protein MetW n=1 Tax=Algihabitans sp. TaxID=2821514 RepID=UPI003BAB1931